MSNLKSCFQGILSKDPGVFFTISRANEDSTFSPVYRSEKQFTSSPLFDQFNIPLTNLCNSDPDRALEIRILQYKKSGDHLLLGRTSLNLREILEGRTYPLTTPSSRLSIASRPKKAHIQVMQKAIETPASFLDYIVGGTEIHLVVAIDFTVSNGDPHKENSLHYMDGDKMNDYQKAIWNVGSILQQYDRNKKFAVYGFGAKFNHVLSHAYPLNNDFGNPEVDGVEGILEAYTREIRKVELYGPTNFSPIINQTAERIQEKIRAGYDNIYYMLLIITDGVITDLESTKRAIIRACTLPLSIVIVGVGDADFTNMKVLDADYEKLEVQGVTMERDIVQFVAFSECKSELQLTKEVLEEIPSQFMGYMRAHKILPRNPVRMMTADLLASGSQPPAGPPPAYSRE
ncbi:2361_t:CDS:10 [Paraglomus brasilianum]|uniref:2361_t:CDS:1 n=1 Tax=Paraglomus brasilianum TaxID=144538 RepID=A0A9N9CGD8_9GLOM|nr:2361_t:CDS:10 [Paraglomus brasilianum]